MFVIKIVSVTLACTGDVHYLKLKSSQRWKTDFLNFFFHSGIRNKKLGKVKNIQPWIDFRFFSKGQKTAGGGRAGEWILINKIPNCLITKLLSYKLNRLSISYTYIFCILSQWLSLSFCFRFSIFLLFLISICISLFLHQCTLHTVCPRSLDTIYIVTYCMSKKQ